MTPLTTPAVSELIGDAAKAAVDALQIQNPKIRFDPQHGKVTPIPTVKRKTPSVPDNERKGLPQIVISVGQEPATEYLDARRKLRKFPVAVTIVTDEAQWAADDPDLRRIRDQIDAAVDTRAAFRATVPGFSQVDAGGGAPFDVSGLRNDLGYSIQTFTVSVIESRT